MAVELCGLSGSKQGKSFRFATLPVSIGDDDQCDLVLSRREDASAQGKRLKIVQDEHGWRIHNTGRGNLYLNQEVVPSSGGSPIRSGDILRLSEMGPDFRFAIVADSPPPPSRKDASAPDFTEQAEDADQARQSEAGAAEQQQAREDKPKRDERPGKRKQERKPKPAAKSARKSDRGRGDGRQTAAERRKAESTRLTVIAVLIGVALAAIMTIVLALSG